MALLTLGSFSHAADPPDTKIDPLTEATNNTKQLYMLLVDFEQDYGKLPDANTATMVRTNTATNIPLAGKSANAFLRQLIAGGYVAAESIFYAKGKDIRKPDNVTTNGKALAPGECGFAYITGQSTKGKPGTPLLAAPMIPGTTKFDRTVFNGKVVILRIGGGAPLKELTIAEDGHVYENGKDIFDPAQPWWGGKAPVIAYPD